MNKEVISQVLSQIGEQSSLVCDSLFRRACADLLDEDLVIAPCLAVLDSEDFQAAQLKWQSGAITIEETVCLVTATLKIGNLVGKEHALSIIGPRLMQSHYHWLNGGQKHHLHHTLRRATHAAATLVAFAYETANSREPETFRGEFRHFLQTQLGAADSGEAHGVQETILCSHLRLVEESL